MINKNKAILLAGLLLAGCVKPVQEAPPVSSTVPPPRPYSATGLEVVIGATAAALVQAFGPADLDVREGAGRKLQFLSPVCVLDAYLYPTGGREPVVTHLDARLPDGREMDRSSCVAAISRRQQAR